MYDIVYKETLRKLSYWEKQISGHTNTKYEAIIVGNKTDLWNLRYLFSLLENI